MGRERAPAHGGGTGTRLRTHCACMGGARDRRAVFPERGDPRLGAARAGATRRCADARMLRQTKGTAMAVSDEEMLHAGRELASLEGIFAAPEGAATVIAARKLAASGWIKPGESVVLFNTGTGYKYSEAWEKALGN